MKFETDPVKIKKQSLDKEGENWGFRSFLKSCDIPDQKIDRTVQKFFKQVSKKIDCSRCSNCCKEYDPFLTHGDVHKISRGLNITPKEFEKKYLIKTEKRDGFTFIRKPCPFLRDNTCSISNYRPQDCLSYPYRYQENFTQRLISVIRHCSICPIIYNVFELLKDEIWVMDDSEFSTNDEDFNT